MIRRSLKPGYEPPTTKRLEDLESSFDRRRGELERAIKNRQLGVDGLISPLNVDKEKATLLRDQATRIGELMEQQETHVPARPRMKH